MNCLTRTAQLIVGLALLDRLDLMVLRVRVADDHLQWPFGVAWMAWVLARMIVGQMTDTADNIGRQRAGCRLTGRQM